MITNSSSKEEIIEYMKEKSQKLGRTVLRSDMTKQERRIISKAFSSWINAVKQTGLAMPNTPGQNVLRMMQKKRINEDDGHWSWKAEGRRYLS